ncbi:MAG: short-chain dehydrogenase/reductase [Bryobacterales bacterium]|nr:short-chain dehydrogenase/reductase [Bryobacterales bacterium]
MTGKIAIVSGAARGIGRAIALELASRGARLALCDLIDPAETAAAIGPETISAQLDVSDRGALEAFFASLPRVDILVNNAGMSIRKPLVELEVADVERVWQVLLWGAFHTTQLAARRMIAQGEGGAIVNVTSVLAHIPYVNSSPYNGAKAAVNQMTRTWALELAPHRIRANALEPGWTDTPGERAFNTEQQLRAGGERLPLGRLARAEEIAKAAAFLASDDASYITGTVLQVDGGVTLIE